MADGVNPLDPLGPITGSLGQPSLDPSYYETPPGAYPEIKFPDPGANRRNTFGTPGIATRPKLTKDDIEAFNSGLNAYATNAIASGAKTDDFANVSTYDAGPDSNAFYDRYMAYGQEKFDEVGFHPFRNNEANFNANTTWTDDFSRMMSHSFVPLLKTGFTSGWRSLGKMLHGDFTGSDLDEAREYERAAAIGQSSKDGFGAFVNNTVMNFGYTAGIISEVLAEEVALGLATAGSGGGAGGLAVARTGQNINRVRKAFSSFGKMADRTSDMVKSFSNMNAARKFWSAANSRVGRFINPLENTFDLARDINKVVKSGKQLDGLAVISRTAGSLYRDVRTINMAVSEARLEAGMVENHLRDKFYEEFYKENGRPPTKEESDALFKLAKKGATETFYTNAGLIYLTNKITFGNITGPRGGIRNFMQSTMDDIYTVGARAGEKSFGNIGKIFYDNTKKEFVFRANNLKNLAKSWWKEPGIKTFGKTIGYFKANVSEGIQENLQETIARTNERYYEQVFKDSDLLKGQLYSNGVMRMAYKDVNGIFNAPLSMYKEELSKEFSKQGLETFASGFAMGFLATPLNNAMPFLSTQYNRIFNKEAYNQWKDMKMDVTKNIVQNLNAVDINEFLNNRVVNLSTQDVISNIKRKGSYKEAYDAEVESFVRSVGTMTRTGTTDIFINKLKSYKEMTDAELIDAVSGEDINEAPMYRERIDKAITKLEKVQKRYETAKDKFINPIDINSLDESKMSTVEYNQYAALYNAWEESVNNYVYFGEAFEDNAKRMKSIQQDYLKGSALQNVEYNSAKYMFRPQEITDDVKNLELELSLEKEKGTDADQKRVNLLEQQIADLKAYKQAYDNFRKFYNRADSTGEVETELKKELGRQPTPEEISARMDELQGDIADQARQEEILGALKDAHHKYLRNLAQNTNSTVFEENLDDAFNKLVDFYKLDDESTVLARSIDLLSNPAEFTSLVQKNMDFMRRMYNQRSEYYEEMIREQIKMIEANALLNALANQGIYVSAEEFAEYLKTGKAPTEFYDNVNKLLYTEGTEMYDRIYQSTFALMDKLQEQNLPDTPMFVDEVYQQKYEELREEANRKIEALPRTFRRQNKGLVKPIKGKTMSLAEVVEQMSPNEYVELNYEGDEGVQVVYFLDDSGALRMDNVEGDVVILEDVETKFTEGTRYIEDYLPDQKAVDEIIAEFEQQVKDLQDDYAKDKAVEIELGREERFTPISVNDDVDSMPEGLVNKLKGLYDDYLKTTMTEEDYVNMSQDEYDNGFRVFVKSGTTSVKEVIDEYNKSKQVESAVKEKGLKDDFTFNFNGAEIDTKDLSVPNLRSYQRQINNVIKTLDENDPQYQKYQTLVTNLEKVINKRLKEGLTQEQKEAIKKIEELKNKQKPYTVDANGYRIGGSLYRRVTQEIQKLKDKKYAYKDAKKIEEIYGRTIGAEGFNEASINKFVEELKKTDLGGFFEYTYDEVKTQLQELLKGSYDTTTTTTDIVEEWENPTPFKIAKLKARQDLAKDGSTPTDPFDIFSNFTEEEFNRAKEAGQPIKLIDSNKNEYIPETYEEYTKYIEFERKMLAAKIEQAIKADNEQKGIESLVVYLGNNYGYDMNEIAQIKRFVKARREGKTNASAAQWLLGPVSTTTTDTKAKTQISTAEPKLGFQTFNVPISKKEDISNVVAGPLVPASEIFWDKNIRTTGSWLESIQGESGKATDYIDIEYDSLSEENKKIANELSGGGIGNFAGVNFVRFALGSKITAEEAQKKTIEIANKFKQQDLLWYKPNTLEDRISVLENSKKNYSKDASEAIDQEIQRIKDTWGTELRPGEYFDTNTKTIWASKELYDKSKGTTTTVDTTAQQEELKMLQADLAAEEVLVEGKSEDMIAEMKSRIKELESALPKDNLLSKIQSIVSENAYEDSRIAGNYLDNAIKVLFEDGVVPQFDERYMTREAFDSLFGPEGYLTNIRKKVDSGELYIAARDLVVFDDELMIAGEIDLLVADRKGNIFIVDLKTGEKSKWDGFKKANNPYSKLEDYTLQQTAYANLLNRMIGIDPGIALLPIQITKDPKGSGQILTAKKPTSPNVLTTDSLILLDKSLVRDRINTIIPLTKEVVDTSQTNADIFKNEDTDISDDEQDNGLKDSIDNDQLEEDESTEAEKELVKELMKTIKTTRDLDSVRADISMRILTGELSEESIDKLNEALIERANELQGQPKDEISVDMLAKGAILVAKSDIFTKSKTIPYMTEGEEVKVSSISDDGKTVKVRKLRGRTDLEYTIKGLNDKFILKTDLFSDKTESQDDTQMDKSDQEFSKQGSDLVSEFQKDDSKITKVEENTSGKSLDQLDDDLLDDLIC